MRFTIINFILFFITIAPIRAEEALPEWKKVLDCLKAEEKIVLESFFRTMLTRSEGGFVLAGSKPVCMEGILAPEKFNSRKIGSKTHQLSVELSEGFRIWQKYFTSISSKKIIICCKDHTDLLYSDWIHLLWIHPQKLEAVVEKNIALFQYILGPQITADGFLNFLVDPSQDIPHNYTLNGIFLGFGAQNALYYHRLELLQKKMYSREKAPFYHKTEALENKNIGYLGFDHTESFDTEPSFGFSTLSQEYKTLEAMSKRSRETSPLSSFNIPLFAIYKKDKDTLDILSDYETDKKFIETLLASSHFLEEILRCIFE